MAENNKLCSQEVCTGCFACKQACGKGAIHIKEIGGFRYPEIDAPLCVDCGLCSKVCPVLNSQSPDPDNKIEPVCYAVWLKNLDDRMKSSSGGAFSALAEKTFEEGGIVYGAAWDQNMQLNHVGVEDARQLDALRRSKYVQSNTAGVYQDVKAQLRTGRKVLFCGTPCQIGGLLSFLGDKDYPNLITAGVVCHGVPSQRSFDRYVSEVEREENVKITDCNFRSKKRGWRTDLNIVFSAKRFDNKHVTVDKLLKNNVFMNAFLKQYFLRESCYQCPFKGVKIVRVADLMLSDFWSLWFTIPWGTVDFSKGVSAVAVNTEKGRVYLMQCKESIEMLERPYAEFASNTGLRTARKPQNNDAAFEYLKSHTWMETQSKFFPLTFRQRLPLYTRLILGENNSIRIKRLIRKILHR